MAFENTPLLDFALESERTSFRDAVDSVKQTVMKQPYEIAPLGCGLTKIIKNYSLDEALVRMPENTQVLFSKTSDANIEIAKIVLEKLAQSETKWANTPIETRAAILEKAADIIEKRRYELAAIMVMEAGKPWMEADADLAEGVDFCRYYAEEARKLFQVKKMGALQGENNLYFYEPRGLALVLCPWNFPLAIPCGMFAAALVTGNCVILKPAEQSPVIAKLIFEIFLEAGMPEDVAAFLPGKGEVIGDFLARNNNISTIIFTGSKDVGLNLIEMGGYTNQNQKHVKKVIAEMGGKNAIVVDSDADIDEAVKGVLQSSFGFQGQKCSACSRVYVVSDEVFKIFTSRIADAISDLKIGPSSHPSSFAGPVISEESRNRINNIIDNAKQNLTLLVENKLDQTVKDNGHFVAPVAFINVPDEHQIMREEIFGPVLAINKVSSFKEGIEKALESEYRLTGGIFSRSPANIDYAIKNFKVGNLYINRNCTGALVFRQPFGGSHMSGVGSKAGGPDYLIQFVIPRAVSENTMRRGFAPE